MSIRMMSCNLFFRAFVTQIVLLLTAEASSYTLALVNGRVFAGEISPPAIGQNSSILIGIHVDYETDFPLNEYSYNVGTETVPEWYVDGVPLSDCNGSPSVFISSFAGGHLWSIGLHTITVYATARLEATTDEDGTFEIWAPRTFVGEMIVITYEFGEIIFEENEGGEEPPEDEPPEDTPIITAAADSGVKEIARRAQNDSPVAPLYADTRCTLTLESRPPGYGNYLNGKLRNSDGFLQKIANSSQMLYVAPQELKSYYNVPPIIQIHASFNPTRSEDPIDLEPQLITVLQSVFEYMRAKTRYNDAAKYANWKYDIGVSNFTHNEEICNANGTAFACITQSPNIYFSKRACKTEWRCASVLLHEKYHLNFNLIQRQKWIKDMGKEIAEDYEEYHALYVEYYHGVANGRTPQTYVYFDEVYSILLLSDIKTLRGWYVGIPHFNHRQSCPCLACSP